MAGDTDRPKRPLAEGDRVTLRVGDEVLQGQVCAIDPWNYIAVRSDDGRLWMDVMMNRSAAYWSRLVQLDGDTDCGDRVRLDTIASACADSWGREPVAGMVRVCDTGDRFDAAV